MEEDEGKRRLFVRRTHDHSTRPQNSKEVCLSRIIHHTCHDNYMPQIFPYPNLYAAPPRGRVKCSEILEFCVVENII